MKKFEHINFLAVLRKCVNAFLLGLLVILSVQAVYYNWFVDLNKYVHYTAVEATKKTYWIGQEDLFFRSFAEVHKPTTMEWEDTLICDIKGDGLDGGYFSTAKSGRVNYPPSVRDGKNIWRYGAPIPIQPAKCFLSSQTLVIFRIFFVFDLKRPIDPINSVFHFDFKKPKQ